MTLSSGRWARVAALTGFLLAGGWVAGLVMFAEEVVRQTVPGDRQTDAIVALTGENNRLPASIALLKAGLAERLFISGVHNDVHADYLVSLLDSAASDLDCCIEVGHVARNTRGNARETADWIALQEIGSIRLVTSNYHMPRSLLEFRRAIPHIDIVPHPIETELVVLEPWYGSLSSVSLMAREFTKYLAVRLGV